MKKENTFLMNRQTPKWKTLLLSSLFFFFVFAINAQDYCEPTYGSSTGDYLSEVSTEGAEADISYTASSGGAHFDETTKIIITYAGQEFNVHTAYVGGGHTIGAWVDWNENGIFGDENEQVFLSNGTSPQNFMMTIPSDIDNGQYRMRIRGSFGNKEGQGNDFACNNQSWGSSIDVIIEIADAPSCIKPTALTSEDITAEDVEISWEGNADSYNIQYGIAGFELGSGTMIENINSPYILDGLSPITNYDIYVQANCEEDETSNWTLTSLKTACAAITEMIEDFDSYDTGAFLPDCWVRVTEGSGSATISSTTPASGTRNMYMSSFSNTNKAMAVLPEFSNVNAGTHWLKFKVRASTANGTLKLGYVTEDENSLDDFIELETISVPNTTYTDSEQEYIIPDNIPADARLAILNPGINSYSFYMDDFIWEEVPSCFIPEDVSVGNITTDSAEITWVGDTDSYNIEWGEAGFEQGEGSMEVATDTSYELTDLDADTAYEIYIRSVCGENDESLWVGPIAFSTACFATDVPFYQDFDQVTVPAIPNCGFLETNSGNAWKSESSVTNFSGNVLSYTYHSTNAADSWYFTQGINMEEGVQYKISYKYGNIASWQENLKVAIGTAASSSAMNDELDNHLNFTGIHTNEITFTVDADNVYYFGFQAHSVADKNRIYLDGK